jgi:hypothetical protein
MFMINNHLELCLDIEFTTLCMHAIIIMARWTEKRAFEVTLTHLNGCRLYMGISSLAEIVSGDGKRILKHLFEGDDSVCCSSIIWPTQQKPGKKDWEVWKEWLSNFVVNCNNLRLGQPLGKWIYGCSGWTWWLYKENEILYQQTSTGAVEYGKSRAVG